MMTATAIVTATNDDDYDDDKYMYRCEDNIKIGFKRNVVLGRELHLSGSG
jgi:hypothetical protein